MSDTRGERQWMRGYEAARSLCLAQGADLALRQKPPTSNTAYEAGYDWGLWDYEDANGLPHRRERGA